MKEKQILDTDRLKIEETIDSNEKKDSDEHTEDNPATDNQFFGTWYSYKVTHSITINGTPKDSVPYMFERIQLVKPWEIMPVDPRIKK